MMVDKFRQQRVEEVGSRFGEVQTEHRRQESAMWIGTLVTSFDAFELELLNELGLLTIRDYDLIRRAKEAHHHNGEFLETWSGRAEMS